MTVIKGRMADDLYRITTRIPTKFLLNTTYPRYFRYCSLRIVKFLIDDSTYKDGFREYDYEIKQILLKNLIKSVPLGSICGCPPKRYQSEGESQKIIKENKENQSVNTNDSTLKKLRKCHIVYAVSIIIQSCDYTGDGMLQRFKAILFV
ncbi:hypothetical protein RhiirA5_408541 [Rhizophagus irregularis]|uniref:Uncharacterized protein n=1 Tax=Rhizophagus irregularis TaxID=588596 RepID=A0A2N0Q7V8_9GLOM|nr:hypothetical protein RhiirA5_408541 [Rhizophagus irregularis]